MIKFARFIGYAISTLFIVGIALSVGFAFDASFDRFGWPVLLFWAPWLASAIFVTKIIEKIASDEGDDEK